MKAWLDEWLVSIVFILLSGLISTKIMLTIESIKEIRQRRKDKK